MPALPRNPEHGASQSSPDNGTWDAAQNLTMTDSTITTISTVGTSFMSR